MVIDVAIFIVVLMLLVLMILLPSSDDSSSLSRAGYFFMHSISHRLLVNHVLYRIFSVSEHQFVKHRG